MKSDIHPEYRAVVFQDTSAGTSFLTRSTIETKESIVWEDGNEYPLAKVEISSESHPFYTGQMKIVDTAGPCGALRKALRKTQEARLLRLALS